MSDDEVEAVLDRVLTLFRHLNSKDVFEAFYRKLLAKRLLLGKSASADLERFVPSPCLFFCRVALTPCCG